MGDETGDLRRLGAGALSESSSSTDDGGVGDVSIPYAVILVGLKGSASMAEIVIVSIAGCAVVLGIGVV